MTKVVDGSIQLEKGGQGQSLDDDFAGCMLDSIVVVHVKRQGVRVSVSQEGEEGSRQGRERWNTIVVVVVCVDVLVVSYLEVLEGILVQTLVECNHTLVPLIEFVLLYEKGVSG